MAEGIMKNFILDEFDEKQQIVPMEVLSAGTYAQNGYPASSHAIEVADKHGINLQFHRSRMITEQLVNYADLILTMEENHVQYIRQLVPDITGVYELKRYGRDSELSKDSFDVLDPIGRDISVYREVYGELEEEIKRISQKVFSLALEKYRSK